jgi:hypothetical protein
MILRAQAVVLPVIDKQRIFASTALSSAGIVCCTRAWKFETALVSGAPHEDINNKRQYRKQNLIINILYDVLVGTRADLMLIFAL